MTARWQEKQPSATPPPATATAQYAVTAEPSAATGQAADAGRYPVRSRRRAGLLAAALQAPPPRQWPKNLLVFAAPLAGATLGRPDGFGYALVAFAAFTAAASAVYLINDVVDADRDRQHPVKRLRPIASGRLPREVALAEAGGALARAGRAWVLIREPRLGIVIAAYVAISLLYSTNLKHVPGVELTVVAFGFVLRALGGAIATHVPPSGWFLTVCSLGALMVAVSKRRGELATLGDGAASHRPVVRFYRYRSLGVVSRLLTAAMVVSYALWAVTSSAGDREAWHLASIVPLAVALARFDWLSGHADGKPVEDLIIRARFMAVAELAWLGLFAAGLVAARR